jgi:hypothetical protein
LLKSLNSLTVLTVDVVVIRNYCEFPKSSDVFNENGLSSALGDFSVGMRRVLKCSNGFVAQSGLNSVNVTCIGSSLWRGILTKNLSCIRKISFLVLHPLDILVPLEAQKSRLSRSCLWRALSMSRWWYSTYPYQVVFSDGLSHRDW